MAAEGGSLPSPTIKTNSNYIAVQPAAPQQTSIPTQQTQQRIQASPQRIINQQGQQVLFINNDLQQQQPHQTQTNTTQRTAIVPRIVSFFHQTMF